MNVPALNPGPLLEISGAYWRSCTLHAGVRLDVFTRIGNEYATGAELAKDLGVDERALVMLLNALAAMGLLEKSGPRYGNTPLSGTYLNKGSREYVGYMILHHHHLVDAWSKLPEAVASGKPPQTRSHGEAQEREAFLMGMFNLAMGIAPRLAPVIDLSGRTRLLDLGGGPGTYAIHFCMAYPNLKARVFDLPSSRFFAARTIESFGLSDRIEFIGGDFTKQDLPGRYDVAWLSHILHGEGPEFCGDLIRKAVSVLEPGGVILIHDFILEDSKDRPLFPAVFSLNMLLNTERGQSYSEGEIRGMLEAAGVSQIKRLGFRGPNDSSVMTGVAK